MRHCVSGYDYRCVKGDAVFVSLRKNGARCLTIEVRANTHFIAQVRGQCNRLPSTEEQAVIAEWLQSVL